MIKKLPGLVILILISLSFGLIPALAQLNGVEVVASLPVADSKAVDGDILVMTDKGLVLANIVADSRLFGVLQKQPVANYKPIDNSGQPVARTGIATINVTTLGGPINKGDYITSSDIPGKGQKTNAPGFVIGVALDSLAESKTPQLDYKNSTNPFLNKKVTTGKITIALRVEYHDMVTGLREASRIFGPLGNVIFANIQDPEKFIQIVKYLIAGLAFLVAIFIGFVSFSRSLAKSVEAMGRNPLAKKAIYVTIVLNVVLTIVLALIGALAAYIIIKI